MLEKPQVELKDIQEPSEKSSDGLEIVRTPELENIVAKASNLAGRIERNEGIPAEEILELDKSLDELKFNFYGEQLSVSEIRQIPDFHHNLEIWREIEQGIYRNYRWLTHLPPQIAETLVNANLKDEDDAYILTFDKLTKMSSATAEKLSRYKGALFLDKFETIADDVIKKLSQFSGNFIALRELKTISEEGIKSIVASERKRLTERFGAKSKFGKFASKLFDEDSIFKILAPKIKDKLDKKREESDTHKF